MKIAVINVDCISGGSTGRIAAEIAKEQATEKDEIFFAFGRDSRQDSRIHEYRVSGKISLYTHVILTRIFDCHGFGSYFATKKLIKKLEEFQPDVLWIHNIHGYYINMDVLFRWLKQQKRCKINWLLHDCWSFTGHCGYFTAIGCEKWKYQCSHCPQKKEYPSSYFIDNSKNNYKKKKELFTGIPNLTIITPSEWLANLVKESFLKEYPVIVRHNRIDLSVFKPTKSNIMEKYHIGEKFTILGVANIWNKRKGIEDFYVLRKKLDSKYAIVLIGLSKEQLSSLPDGIIGIQRTDSVEELVKLYSASDVLFNPTYEDNYPTVNLEAEACGTPVITYCTGGCPETINNTDSRVIDVGDIGEAERNIVSLYKKSSNKKITENP